MGIEKGKYINDSPLIEEPIKKIGLQIKDNAITSNKIAGEAVTQEKLSDDSVSTRTIINKNVTKEKIADSAIGTGQLEDGSVTTSKVSEKAITTSKINEEAVTTEKIKDANVTWEKIDANLKNIIATGGGQHGIPLATEFGNSDEVGITQKTLTESRNDLQNQINTIINDKAVVSLAASPNPVFVGDESVISLTATTDTEASLITISKGVTIIDAGSGLTLSTTDTITPSEAGNTTYIARFTIAGLQKTATKSVTAVYPVYYGAGSDYTDATNQASARITPAGTYTVTVANDEDYVFFVVPRTMNITSAQMSGFDFPLEASVNVEIEDVEYKYYQGSNTYDAGTLTIVIS